MKPDKFTVHCSDSANGVRVDISEIRQWHLARGFTDVGYHVVIQPDGEIQPGRGLNVVGAHVKGANEGNLGICLVGRDKFSKAQFDAMAKWIENVRRIYTIDPWEVYGHYEFPSAREQGKTCPNMDIRRIHWFLSTGDSRGLLPYLAEGKV